jgi:hypothetical protein
MNVQFPYQPYQSQDWQQYLQQSSPLQQQLSVLGNILSEVAELNQRQKQTNELLSVLIDLIPISDFASRGEAPKHKGKKK